MAFLIHSTEKPFRLRTGTFPRAAGLLGKAGPFLVLLYLFLGLNCGSGAEFSLPEDRVKSIFLLNFAKYVTWPAKAFASTNAPLVIGVLGEEEFSDELKRTVEGKTVEGHKIITLHLNPGEDFGQCHILYIAASKKKDLKEILRRVNALPVLTVGETEQFLQSGGAINFIKKENKVRLEISLNAARKAKLEISSKLLGVADVVKEN